MTSCTKLHASPIDSDALMCTLTHCVLDSASCMMLYHLLYPCLCMCCFSVCLFVCLFVLVSQCHVSPALFVYSPFQIVSIVDRQWADAKSNCTHCIRRGL